MEGSSNTPQNRRSNPTRHRTVAVGVAVISVAVVSLALWQKRHPVRKYSASPRERSAQPLEPGVAGPPAPPRSTSPYLNTGPEVEYVGSEACRNCHRQAHRSFATTPHCRSFSLVSKTDQPPDGVVDHPLSGRSYRVERVDGKVQHRESVLGGDGSRTELAAYSVKYQIGSGHIARSYLIEDGGFLLESPVTWFTRAGRWDMSPGYDVANHHSFGRTIRGGCLYCHVGHVQAPEQNGLRHQIAETAIGCERCHGPGELHVRKQTNRLEIDETAEHDQTIVNPRRLSRELGEAICAQCHLQGSAKATVRGRRPEDFRPGLPLREYRLEFRSESPEADMTVAGHVEQLHQSRCHQNSTTLSCITCHHPHDELSPTDNLARHREICAGCHQQQPCRVPVEQRKSSNGDDCIQCHMPRAATEVTHVALTHHRIGIHTEEFPRDESKKSADTVSLIPLQPLDHLSDLDRNRSLGLATLALVRLAGKSPEEIPRLQRAAALLRLAYDGGIRDAETLTALAGIARDTGRLSLGMTLAEQALRSDDIDAEVRLEAFDVLAELHFRTGKLQTAAGFLQAINRGSRSPMHWFLLGQIEQKSGDRKAALTALRKAVELAPEIAEYHRALVPLLQDSGSKQEADRHRQFAELLARQRPSASE